MQKVTILFCLFVVSSICSANARAGSAKRQAIKHDAEFYILTEQHGQRWAAEDREISARLADLRKKHGRPPNIVHVLWDDTSFGDVGIPAINKIRGFETPALNRMAEEGILFTRMYTEPSCTPSRAACMTGRHPVRYGMYAVGFPVEYKGLRAEEVTIAEVLSQAGYATFVPKGWVMTIEGKKGEAGREWRGTSHEDYLAIDPECQKRTIDFIRSSARAERPFYVAAWPNLTSFIPSPKKLTVSRAIYTDHMQHNVDAFIGRLMDELRQLGIAENTLVIAMADNGPMSHNPPPGLGMTETIFRGGKGDFLEGGVRVPAFTGLANARPETKALARPRVDLKKLPFDPLEYIQHELPYDGMDPDLGE